MLNFLVWICVFSHWFYYAFLQWIKELFSDWYVLPVEKHTPCKTIIILFNFKDVSTFSNPSLIFLCCSQDCQFSTTFLKYWKPEEVLPYCHLIKVLIFAEIMLHAISMLLSRMQNTVTVIDLLLCIYYTEMCLSRFQLPRDSERSLWLLSHQYLPLCQLCVICKYYWIAFIYFSSPRYWELSVYYQASWMLEIHLFCEDSPSRMAFFNQLIVYILIH